MDSGGSFSTECGGRGYSVDRDAGMMTGRASAGRLDLEVEQMGESWPFGEGNNPEGWSYLEVLEAER